MLKDLRFAFLLLVIICAFFYKTLIFGYMPFPGDLLVNQNPYRTQSYLGYAPGGYPNKAQGRDVIQEMFPWKYFSINELKDDRVPFWNPHNFSGNLQMQNFQTAIFYPLNVMFFIFSFNSAWTIYIILQPFLAAWFMYLLLREFKLKEKSSLIGAIAFAFSSYFVVWMEYGNIDHTFLWLPLVLLLITRFIERRRLNYFLFLILTLGTSLLGGYIQGDFYLYCVFLTYSIFIAYQKKKISFLFISDLFFISFLPILLTAFQWLPTFTLFKESARGSYSLAQIDNLLQPWYYLVTIFAPDFFGNPATNNYWLQLTYIERVMYVGIPILFFATYAVTGKFFNTVKNKHRNPVIFFSVSAIISLVLSVNILGIKFFYLLPIPVLSTTVPTRVLCVFIFSLIILGCYGIDRWLENGPENKKIPVIFGGIYLLLILIVLAGSKLYPSYHNQLSVSFHNLIIPAVIAFLTIIIFFSLRKKSEIVFILLFILVIADCYYFFQKITPFSPQSFVYPQTPIVKFLQNTAGINRFWGLGSAYIPPNFQTYDGTYSPEGDDPLHIRSYGELIESSNTGKFPNTLPRPDANIAPGFGSDEFVNNRSRQTILNLLGVKYILTTPSTLLPNDHYRLVWHDSSWNVYENGNALSRYFLASKFILYSTDKEAINKIYNTDLANTIILNQNPSIVPNPNATGSIALSSYEPQKVVFTTETNGPMLLFLSDTYTEKWSVSIDNAETKLLKADFAFRSVLVPAGKHTVRMYYTHRDFNIGLIIAAAGLIACSFYGYYLRRYVSK